MLLRRLLCALVLVSLLSVVLGPGVASAKDGSVKRTLETYTVPDVTLINQNGEKVRLRELLASDKPVIVDFIFGTCTTICPILSVSFSNLQQKLGNDSRSVRLVSISIDPEHDTPKVMRDYLKRYRSKPGWDFLSGSRADIDKVMHAFDAYIPNKMSHYPLTLIKAPGEARWIRLFGLMGSGEFMDEVRKVGGK